jgi:peptide/nickel transport system permease protein
MASTAEATPLGVSRSVDDLLTPPLTLRQLVWLRFRRHKMALFGVAVLTLLVLYSFGGAFFLSEAYANATDTKMRLQSPMAGHPFGTDTVGRDILARTIYGGQISLIIGLTAALVETIIGVLVGALAGYYGGLLDGILMRVTEAMLSVPQLFLLIVMAKFFGGQIPDLTLMGRTFSGSVIVIIGIIGVTSWMYLARIVRAEFLSLKENEFVLAARAIGTPRWQIIFQHILPNSIAPIIVSATLGVANAISAEAYISFLGMGVRPPTATWGNMLDGAYNYIETAPWLWIFPGMLIVLTVLSINFLGDGLRDALDPRSRAA